RDSRLDDSGGAREPARPLREARHSARFGPARRHAAPPRAARHRPPRAPVRPRGEGAGSGEIRPRAGRRRLRAQAGRGARGHRRLGAREIAVTPADYEQRLRDHFVILSAAERRDKISRELMGVLVKPDHSLLETLVYLTEYPTPITGGFDQQFLELPEEVLVT